MSVETTLATDPVPKQNAAPSRGIVLMIAMVATAHIANGDFIADDDDRASLADYPPSIIVKSGPAGGIVVVTGTVLGFDGTCRIRGAFPVILRRHDATRCCVKRDKVIIAAIAVVERISVNQQPASTPPQGCRSAG